MLPRSLAMLAAAGSMTALSCGSSSNNNTNTGAGTHYHYVVSRVMVPTEAGQAGMFGLDLNGDGVVDNQLGSILAALNGEGINAQVDIDEAVFGGNITLLVDVQTTDPTFMSATNTGIQVFEGADANPPACNSGEVVTCGSGTDMSCTGCQHDLTGSASFSISASSPTNPALTGSITGGTYTAGPGTLSLQIALGSGSPIDLDLIGARVKATDMTATTIGSQSGMTGGIIFGGGVSQTDLNTQVLPQVVTLAQGEIEKHCFGNEGSGGTGVCDCDSTGTTILGLLGAEGSAATGSGAGSPACTITLADIQASTTASSLLAPDITINGMPALSLGVLAYAVGADFSNGSAD